MDTTLPGLFLLQTMFFTLGRVCLCCSQPLSPLGSHVREKKLGHDYANFYPHCWAYRVCLTSVRKGTTKVGCPLFCLWLDWATELNWTEFTHSIFIFINWGSESLENYYTEFLDKKTTTSCWPWTGRHWNPPKKDTPHPKTKETP